MEPRVKQRLELARTLVDTIQQLPGQSFQCILSLNSCAAATSDAVTAPDASVVQDIQSILSQIHASLEEEKVSYRAQLAKASYDWWFIPWPGDPYCSKKRWGVLTKSILLRVRNWALMVIAVAQFPELHYQDATLFAVAGMELVGAAAKYVLYQSRRYGAWDSHMWAEHSRANLPATYTHNVDPGIIDGA